MLLEGVHGAIAAGVLGDTSTYVRTAMVGDEEVRLSYRQRLLIPDAIAAEDVEKAREYRTLAPIGDLVPGDRVVRAMTTSFENLPSWIGARVLTRGTLASATGETLEAGDSRFEITPGPAADAAALSAAGLTTTMEIEALRPGDVILRREVDHAAASDAVVTVVSPASRYDARSSETTIRSEDGKTVQVRTSTESEVAVLSRTIASMPLEDQVALLQAAAPVPGITLRATADLAPGEPIDAVSIANGSPHPVTIERRELRSHRDVPWVMTTTIDGQEQRIDQRAVPDVVVDRSVDADLDGLQKRLAVLAETGPGGTAQTPPPAPRPGHSPVPSITSPPVTDHDGTTNPTAQGPLRPSAPVTA